MVIQEVNKKDKRMKNLFLSMSKEIINNLVSPTIKEISNAFQKFVLRFKVIIKLFQI